MFTILLTIIFVLLWLIYKHDEIQQRRGQEKILYLNEGTIIADIEQVIEKTSSSSNQKLLLNNRYIRHIRSSTEQDAHAWSFPILLDSKPYDEEEGYLKQVFLIQLDKYVRETGCVAQWSDKGDRLQLTPTFGEVLRYNNQYHLNLQLSFSYN